MYDDTPPAVTKGELMLQRSATAAALALFTGSLSATTFTVVNSDRLWRRLAAPGDPGRQRLRRRRYRRLQHRRLGRSYDCARHLPARDQSAAHDRRLHAVGLLPQHARHDARPRHRPPDRDRRRRVRRQLDLPGCRGGGRHDPRPRDPQLRLRWHPAPELRHEHRDRRQLPRKRRDGSPCAVRVEASGPHRRQGAGESPDRGRRRRPAT